jgi:hypothetical protein
MSGPGNQPDSASGSRLTCRSEAALSLVEVLVAVAIVMVLLVPLMVRGLSLYSRADIVVTRPTSTEASSLGDWGPETQRVQLKDRGVEPVLRALDAKPIRAGLWVGGWLRDERSAEPGAPLLLAPRIEWAGIEPADVVIRVREAAGPWGPPHRITSSGNIPAEPLEGGDGGVLVHFPELGDFLLESTWLTSPITGTSPWRGTVPEGGGTIESAAVSQRWTAEPGRDLDVYY